MITSPSLLNPSGNGSMNILLSELPSDEITLSATEILPRTADPPPITKLPPMFTFFSTPTPPSTIIAPVSFVVD